MQITRYTDYSLRTLLYLSALRDDELATITEIAEAYDISRNHVVKVVHNLGKLGYVFTQRGRAGGLRLAMEPADINVGRLVRQLESNLRAVDCEGCALEDNCSLYGVLARALNAYLKELDQYTLGDVLADRATVKRIRSLTL
ncbi:Rrf2 family transcriptional regulator [Granulosicoccaceae sp. 1_MG-2023]|nr:Rrf2 family transcriptional regulator [Granulosicoccaceae sp. 1_MG-2023]